MSSIAITQDGRYLAASILSVRQWGEIPSATSELVVHDLSQNKSFPIQSHGNRVFSVAFDPSGTKLITGGLDKIVRVGTLNNEMPPYQLIGHHRIVAGVAVHPDGKWIASTEYYGSEVRLWQMPAGKNQMTVPIDAFLGGLRDLTNARIVADRNSTTGYRLQYAPFTGWQRIPNL